MKEADRKIKKVFRKKENLSQHLKKLREERIFKRTKGNVAARIAVQDELVASKFSNLSQKEKEDFELCLAMDDIRPWHFYRLCALAYIEREPSFMYFLSQYSQELNKTLRELLHHKKRIKKPVVYPWFKVRKLLDDYGVPEPKDLLIQQYRMFDVYEEEEEND